MTELLRGVDLSRVDRKHLTKTVKAMKLPTDTSVDSMVATLADHLIRLYKDTPDKLLACEFCGGQSDLSFDRCPYCGKSDEESSQAAAAAPPAEPAKPLVEARSGKPAKPKADKPVAEPKADKPVAEPKPEKAIPKPARASKTKPAEPVVHASEVVPKGKPALAKAKAAALVSAVELDDAVNEIKQLQVGIVVNHWLLGQKLAESFDKGLYKLRLDAEGKPVYTRWTQWVEAELEISGRYAYDLAAVSQVFTQQDIKDFGVTKLRVLARIPEEAKQKNLLEKAKRQLTNGTPMSRVEIEQEARKDGPLPARKGLGGGSSGDEQKRAETRAETAKQKAEAKGVTVVIQPGRVSIPLYNGAQPPGDPIRAFSLTDEPTAVEDLLNGIKVHYRIVKEKDGLVLVVERTRAN